MKNCKQYDIALSEIICFDGTSSINTSNYFFKDGLDSGRKKILNFHVKSNDYFGTLATLLYILYQDGDNLTKAQRRMLKNICTDLEYMQEDFQILNKKTKNLSKT